MAQSQDPTQIQAPSRGVITHAAIDFIERHGIDKLSMRVLATDLGCGIDRGLAETPQSKGPRRVRPGPTNHHGGLRTRPERPLTVSE